jgi:CYTH domain-containing protein
MSCDNKLSKKTSHQEIERKFLIKILPENLGKYSHSEIIQGYLSVTKDGTETRFRKKGEKYFKTTKSGAGKIRTELESKITQKQFYSNWNKTTGKRIEKTRYEIPNNKGIIELDVYHANLEGLFTAEIEFKNKKASNEFVAPDWMGKEITDDIRYKNQSLAQYGIPKDFVETKSL